MVIWLRTSHASVALADDVVQAHDWAELVRLDEASGYATRAAEAQREQAQREADAIVRRAHWSAACVLDLAHLRADSHARHCEDSGRQRALVHEHAAHLRYVMAGQAALQDVQTRITQIVEQTVAQIVGEVPRAHVFAHVARTVGLHLEAASFLHITVAPDECTLAAAAFAEVCLAHRWLVQPKVQADPALAAGTCVCEWDHGVLHASLEAQLRALAQALADVMPEPPLSAPSVSSAPRGAADDVPALFAFAPK
ncbi:FliH/SctL family protein [Paraburkholderia hayleyella]|uniref:FliH/SctL family protein n=1 Tax=Paraburkholderia hayleyella TaxID=2152889 RepID=UPI001291A1B6|nr:FliH/SctL family protein [Paraburkholderia hayleyella]